MAPGVNMTITLADGQLVGQMTGQGKVPMSAESETMFFPQGIDAEIEFPKDETKGPASQLILHQNGRDTTAKRLDDAEAKKVADAAAAFGKTFKDQTAGRPKSEGSKRTLGIGDLVEWYRANATEGGATPDSFVFQQRPSLAETPPASSLVQ
jgi:hypothetical protein